jgi:hypothetical protein
MLTADTNNPSISTFAAGHPVFIYFAASGLSPNETTTINITVLDEYGVVSNVGTNTTATITADGSGNANYTWRAPTPRLGYYQVNASLADGTTILSLGTRPSGFITYAVVPDPARRVDYGDTGSRFGLQGGFNAKANVIPLLGVRYVFKTTSNWRKLDGDGPGQFESLSTAAQIAALRSVDTPAFNPFYNGTRWNTYTLATPTTADMPSWATLNGTTGNKPTTFGALNPTGASEEPSFMESLAAAFATMAANQTNRYYQMTWEPQYPWCFQGTPAQLVEYYSLAYEKIKAVDPGAIVVGPTLFLRPQSTTDLQALWDAQLGQYVDGLSIHPYVPVFPPEPAASTYEGFVPTLRAQLNASRSAIGIPRIGQALSSIPFIGTEHAFTSLAVGALGKAQGDVRVSIMMLGEGAAFDIGFYVADFWSGTVANDQGYGFYWNLNAGIIYGTDKAGPKPSVPAYAAMTYFLDGTKSKGALTNLAGTQMGYQFTNINTGLVIRVLWDYNTSSSYAVPGAGVSICDWMGNCLPETNTTSSSTIMLGPSPVYLVLSGCNWNDTCPPPSTSNSPSNTIKHSLVYPLLSTTMIGYQ